MSHVYTLAAFCCLQWLFGRAHTVWHNHEEAMKRTKVGATVLVVMHPLVISGTHDWAIYLVGEIHALVQH